MGELFRSKRLSVQESLHFGQHRASIQYNVATLRVATLYCGEPRGKWHTFRWIISKSAYLSR